MDLFQGVSCFYGQLYISLCSYIKNLHIMKKVLFYFFLFILMGVYLSSCNTHKGYNYSNHKKRSEQMHRQTQRVNKHNHNQLDHKCSPKKRR